MKFMQLAAEHAALKDMLERVQMYFAGRNLSRDRGMAHIAEQVNDTLRSLSGLEPVTKKVQFQTKYVPLFSPEEMLAVRKALLWVYNEDNAPYDVEDQLLATWRVLLQRIDENTGNLSFEPAALISMAFKEPGTYESRIVGVDFAPQKYRDETSYIALRAKHTTLPEVTREDDERVFENGPIRPQFEPLGLDAILNDELENLRELGVVEKVKDEH